MNLTKDGLRARFAELTEQRQAILDVSEPLRRDRDALVAAHQAAEQAANAAITKAETGLYDIDQERAMIVRALNGKTTDPAEIEARAKPLN